MPELSSGLSPRCARCNALPIEPRKINDNGETTMKRTGSHHLGLATYDYEGIVDFYTRVLGWEIAWQDLMTGPDGTVHMKHVFFPTCAPRRTCRTFPRSGPPTSIRASAS